MINYETPSLSTYTEAELAASIEAVGPSDGVGGPPP